MKSQQSSVHVCVCGMDGEREQSCRCRCVRMCGRVKAPLKESRQQSGLVLGSLTRKLNEINIILFSNFEFGSTKKECMLNKWHIIYIFIFHEKQVIKLFTKNLKCMFRNNNENNNMMTRILARHTHTNTHWHTHTHTGKQKREKNKNIQSGLVAFIWRSVLLSLSFFFSLWLFIWFT